ncbi:MAG TPA: hypothetical protein DIW86_21585, partial [Pseudomonas sp.]|nr:hypothetical protein [Pseudomonas sp.]
FAVVAQEVRELAQRSASAAKEIKELIMLSVDRVQAGSELAGQAGTTMSDVINAVQRVTDIMGEISAASSEQSSGIGQVSRAVSQMDEATQQNAALVEEASAAAKALEQQAQSLMQEVSIFRIDGSQTSHAYVAPATVPVAAKPQPARPAAKPVAKPVSRPAPKVEAAAAKPARSAPPSDDGDEWETF